jgi:hypothetical protein
LAGYFNRRFTGTSSLSIFAIIRIAYSILIIPNRGIGHGHVIWYSGFSITGAIVSSIGWRVTLEPEDSIFIYELLWMNCG